MTSFKFTESDLEIATLEWLEELGYSVVFGPSIAPDGEAPERLSHKDVLLSGRLRSEVAKINPRIPEDAQEEAIKKVINAVLMLSIAVMTVRLPVTRLSFWIWKIQLTMIGWP